MKFNSKHYKKKGLFSKLYLLTESMWLRMCMCIHYACVRAHTLKKMESFLQNHVFSLARLRIDLIERVIWSRSRNVSLHILIPDSLGNAVVDARLKLPRVCDPVTYIYIYICKKM